MAPTLVLESEPSLYFYRLRHGAHSQVGLAGCFSVDEYDRGVIKKHERTRTDKETDRTKHILALRAQTGLTYLTYRSISAVDEVAARVTARTPLIDFELADGVQRSIWRAGPDDQRELVEAFGAIPALYIADGHHRIAGASRVCRALRGKAHSAAEADADRAGAVEYERFVAVAFPHEQVQILPYNRVVTGLMGRSSAEFLELLSAHIGVRPGVATPAHRGLVSMYLDGHWHELDFGRAANASAGDVLDVTRLQDCVLEPLLGMKDVRSAIRIEFVGGGRGTAELERLIDGGKATVAFSLVPVAVDDLFDVADAGGIMPPKSTWFEPKVCDGLLSHLI